MKTDVDWLEAYKILAGYPPAVVDRIVPLLTQEQRDNLMRVGAGHIFAEWHARRADSASSTQGGT